MPISLGMLSGREMMLGIKVMRMMKISENKETS